MPIANYLGMCYYFRLATWSWRPVAAEIWYFTSLTRVEQDTSRSTPDRAPIKV